jgi:hypothetical protein
MKKLTNVEINTICGGTHQVRCSCSVRLMNGTIFSDDSIITKKDNYSGDNSAGWDDCHPICRRAAYDWAYRVNAGITDMEGGEELISITVGSV